MRDYWNHNVAYHPWLLKQVRGAGSILDAGCGDGLLLKKLAPLCTSVTGLEPYGPSAAQAKERLKDFPNVTVCAETFEAFNAPEGSFDVVIFVASLHHMDQAWALRRARELLSPGGKLLVVGLAQPRGFADYALEALRVLPARMGSFLHREQTSEDVGVPTARANLSFSDIRAIARKELPGATLRRGLYYRYLLSWRK